MRNGGCQCGAVRYEAAGEPLHHALCHCNDCRASAGAPAVAWIAFAEDAVTVTQGATATYEGKSGAGRQFCPTCGTGLFYTNAAVLPGLVDVQSATLDSVADEAPQVHIQVAERLEWMTRLGELPEFERYPGAPG
jgi:hypothetical protein